MSADILLKWYYRIGYYGSLGIYALEIASPIVSTTSKP